MSSGQQQVEHGQQRHETEFDRLLKRTVKFTPFGESREIELNGAAVLQFLAARTKSGAQPTADVIVKFMKLCEARGLDPWQGDAYLLGYDGKEGPQWSVITAVGALYKRAEASPDYDGIESGVIVQRGGEIIERQGDAIYPGDKLIGGWAKLYRKNLSRPVYDALNLGPYDKGRSQWEKDKAGMIVKCAEASVLRKAFPSLLAGLYCKDEEGAIAGDAKPQSEQRAYKESPRERLVAALPATQKPVAEVIAESTIDAEQQPDPDGEMGARE